MPHRFPKTPAPPERPKGTPASPVEPDPEWEEMQAMLDRIVREPMEFDKADVAVTAGHMNAAHAEGPITLHDGIDTQPPEARVILGDAGLPTKVLSREPLTVTGLPRQSGRTIIILASGLAAVLIAGAIVLMLIHRNGTEPTEPAAAGASPPSLRATKPATGTPETVPAPLPSAAPPSPVSSPVPATSLAPLPLPLPPGVASAAPAASPSSTPPGTTNVAKTPSRSSSSHHSTTTLPSPVPAGPAAPAIPQESPEQINKPDWRSPRRF